MAHNISFALAAFTGLSLTDAQPLEAARGWDVVLSDILPTVSSHLSPKDFANARLVCRHWRSFYTRLITHVRFAPSKILFEPQLPVLVTNCCGRHVLVGILGAFHCLDHITLALPSRWKLRRDCLQSVLEVYLSGIGKNASGLQSLTLLINLSSFNERKVQAPSFQVLSSWASLKTLTLQESDWTSQQLRVDPAPIFDLLKGLHTLQVSGPHQADVKAQWVRNARQEADAGSCVPTLSSAALTGAVVAAGPHTGSLFSKCPSVCFTTHMRCQLSQNQSMAEVSLWV